MIASDTFACCLRHLYPCTGLILVGAGNGIGLAAERYAGIPRLLALEADDRAFRHLQANFPDHSGWIASRVLVSGLVEEACFHVASNPLESGLLDPEFLKPVWRNLISLTSRQEPATTLGVLLKQENNAKDYNWLIIDCLPAIYLLSGLGESVSQFDVIELRLLAKTTGLQDRACDQAESDTFLESLGYSRVLVVAGNNPDILYAVYVRDIRHQLKQVADGLKRQYLETVEAISLRVDSLIQDKDYLSKENDNLVAILNKKESEAEKISQQNHILLDQLSTLNADLLKIRVQIEGVIKQEVSNATQQLESFINIQRFFTHGDYLPVMHGWPVSPDFALYLIELLQKNDYDLVLEFGSGTSTVLIAKTLGKMNSKRVGLGKRAAVQVAFEHLEKYHVQTLGNLESASLEESVHLVLAPLQPFIAPNGRTYPYYACSQMLAKVAEDFSAENIKILMVVDGPPGNTGKHARYPALPAVLEKFNGRAIDVLLDDYFRDDEKEIGDLWKRDFEFSSYDITFEKIKTEKETLFISALPR